MIKFNSFRKIAAFGLLLSSFALFSGCKNGDEAVITGFSFKKASNSSVTKLTKDVSAASIDEVNKVITIELPASLYSDYAERALLKASVELSEGTELLTDLSKLDFSQNPVAITVINSVNSSTYVVDVKEAVSAAPANSLFFTEYYSPASVDLSYKGTNDQYIEITNKSKNKVDLSKVQLTRCHWENGERRADMDQTVTLSGSLNAGGILVIYSQRSIMFASKDSSKFVSDLPYNSIITMNGYDGFKLTSNDVVLDSIGPDNGNGSGLCWGLGKSMQRKDKVVKYTKFNESEWITYSSSSSSAKPTDTAGLVTPEDKADTYDITYFALESTPSILYGIIDTSAKTILVNIPTVYGFVHKITASTNGQRVRYGNTDVKTGETEIDFSKATVEKPAILKVFNSKGESVDYKLYANMLNYHFTTSPGGYYFPMTDAPKDGDQVMFYYPAAKYVIGSTASSGKLKAVDAYLSDDGVVYESGMASFAVSVDNDSNYVFTCGSKYLTSKAGGNGLSLEDSPTDYSKWTLESAGENKFYVINVGAKDQALEYYSGFTTYGNYSGAIYQFQFIKKN